jgi:hypothetical protein
MFYRTRVHGFANRVWRTLSGNIMVEEGLLVPKRMNVLAVLGRDFGREKILIPAHNIVTDEGDKYYAQKAVAESPTNPFNRLAMASARTGAWTKSGATSQYGNATVISGSSQAFDSTYPKTNDSDADNTGDGVDVVTFRVSYTAASFNGTVIAGIIHDSAQTSGTSPLLTGFDITSFTKTASDTLKFFVNHNVTGS